jgi:hypothetical protein
LKRSLLQFLWIIYWLLITNSAHAKSPPLIVNERFNLPPPVAEHGFSALVNIVKDTKNTAEKILVIHFSLIQE